MRSVWRMSEAHVWQRLTVPGATFQMVKGSATITVLTLSKTTAHVGDVIHLTATSKHGVSPMTTGTITITATVGGVTTTVKSGAPVSGSLSADYTTTASGTVTFKAAYADSGSTYAPSNDTENLTVSKIATTVSLSLSPTTVTEGGSVRLTISTAAKTGKIGFEYSTDNGVTWKDWGTGADITLPTTTKDWTSNTPAAKWKWRAKHRGDATYSASPVSNAVSVTVNSAAPVVTTYSSTWSKSWQSDGGVRGADPLYRGYYSSTNGDQRSAVGFNYTIPAGKTIKKVEVYLHAEHWFNNGGGTLSIGVHSLTSAPGSYPSPAPASVATATWTSKTGGKWVEIPVATWGTSKGIVLRPSGGTSQSSYCYFTGHGGGTNEPKLRITYQ